MGRVQSLLADAEHHNYPEQLVRKLQLGFACAALLSVIGCSPDDAPPPTAARELPAFRSALIGAPAILANAESGTLGRGEEDLLVRFERQLPGFGGLYIANGNVRVYMKPSSLPAAAVQAALSAVYASHRNPAVRRAMANAGAAIVLQGAYSLSELIAIQDRIVQNGGRLSGFTGVGTNLMTNRDVVTFADNASLSKGLSVMESIGVPLEALSGMIVPPRRPLTSTFQQQSFRPTHAGIEQDYYNATTHPPFTRNDTTFRETSGCSLGFNVQTNSGANYFMSAAHCVVEYEGINGITGDTAYQPIFNNIAPANPVGRIVINPPYGQGAACPLSDTLVQKHYAYCTKTDVMLGQYFTGVSGSRTIGMSVTGGVNGNPGSQAINNWFSIHFVLTPEYVDSTMLHDGGKVGMMSGTTSGKFNFTNGAVVAGTCIPLDCPNGDQLIIYQNVAEVRADIIGGDSGGAVFTNTPGWTAPYAALGIVVLGARPSGLANNATCTSCVFDFARWDQIELAMGLGTLNPNTTIP